MFASSRRAPILARALALASAAILGLALLPETASAQVYGYGSGYGYGQGQTYGSSAYQPCQTGCGYNAPRRRYNSYNGQADVPGDYRCDAYWDANRTDCNDSWRNQDSGSRRSGSRAYGQRYQGYGSSSYGYGGYSRGYGGGAVYQGQYGQPDVVYSGGGYQGGGYQGGDYQGGRDQRRIDWCCAEYRSYDPATGYYTAYSGERIFCG
ncbi:hypothetical protein BH10PSE2_BH10PSE2_22690 [soil metagenome]